MSNEELDQDNKQLEEDALTGESALEGFSFTDAIADSGNRRKFSTGAVRDIEAGKGRMDLLPVSEIACLMPSEPIARIVDQIGAFMQTGNLQHIQIAAAIFIDDVMKVSRYVGMMELSKHYEGGAVKYGERNWEQGIPLHSFVDSGLRHLMKYAEGITDERHDRAFLWNMVGLMWTGLHRPEMCDIPFDLLGVRQSTDSSTEETPAKSAESVKNASENLV